MTEITAILVTGSGFIIVNLVGWFWNIRLHDRKEGKREGHNDQQMEAILGKVDNISSRIDKLPCVYDVNYQQNMGGFFQKITDIGKRVERIDKVINNRS